jgi:hypothetical protein
LVEENLILKNKKIIILPVVLYGCVTWSLTVRENQSVGVFKNSVLRTIFELKGDEVIIRWRKLHNEDLHKLYSPPNIIRMMKSRRMIWEGHVACPGGREYI